jgi:sec-independent protein translocase protein TatB
MFDVGFSEILVIAVVALLVLGPERLPKAARFAGLWLRRARAHWNSVKAEFENELADEELRRNLQQARSELHDTLHSTRELIEPTASQPATIESTAPSTASTDVHAQPVMTALPRGEPAAGDASAARPDIPSADG